MAVASRSWRSIEEDWCNFAATAADDGDAGERRTSAAEQPIVVGLVAAAEWTIDC